MPRPRPPRRLPYQVAAVLAAMAVLLSAGGEAPESSEAQAAGGALAAPGGIAMGGAWTWIDPAVQAADLDRLSAAGARWIRISFRWAAMQPAPDRYDWSVVDRIVRLAHERDLTVLANVAYTPAWARAAGCDHPHCPPAEVGTYAAFVETAVARYSGYGVRGWEIWNEPNLGGFWRPAPNAGHYTALLRAASTAAKRADPSVVVLSGGLGPRAEDSPGNLTPATFLQQMYDAGAAGAMDAVGIHPYSFPRAPLDPHPTNTFAQLPDLHQQMADHGDGGKQLWITEFGYWTSPLGLVHWGGSVTEAQQARYLRNAYGAARARSWLGPVFWFTLRDTGVGETADLQRDRNFGLIREDGTAKPALGAFESAMDPRAFTTLQTRTVAEPDRLRVVARLRDGPPAATVHVAVQRRTPDGWRQVRGRTGTLNATGAFRPAFRPVAAGECRVRARFAGTLTHQPSTRFLRFLC